MRDRMFEVSLRGDPVLGRIIHEFGKDQKRAVDWTLLPLFQT